MKYMVGEKMMQIFNLYSSTLSLFTAKLKPCRFNFFFSNSAEFFFPTRKENWTYKPIFGKLPENNVPTGKKKTKPLWL